MADTVYATVSTPGPAGPPGYSPKFIVAAGAPSNATGNNGDMYINSSNGDVYGPKTGGAWGAVACNIKGATGAAGYSPLYIVAAGPPSAGVGNNGDMYINSTTSDVYGPKAGGAWGGVVANIRGATGPTGPTGGTGPQGPPGVAYTPMGAWAAGTTYKQGDEVTDAGILYISLQSGNVGNTPASSPTYWQAVASGGSQTPWLSNINGGGFNLSNVGSIAATRASFIDTSTAANPLSVQSGQTGTTVRSNPTGRFMSQAVGRDVCVQFSDGVANAAEVGMLSGDLYICAGAYERMRITTGGYVGIGVASPQNKLVVSNNGANGLEVNPNVSAGGAVGAYLASYNRSAGAFSDLIIDTGMRHVFKAGGNFGVCTTNPQSPLTVAGSSAYNAWGTLSVQDTVNPSRNVWIGYDPNYEAGWIQAIVNGAGYKPLFLNAAGGNVAIATVTPDSANKLEVNGPIACWAGYGMWLNRARSSGFNDSDGSGQVTVRAGNIDSRVVILPNGYVGVNRATPNSQFWVSGGGAAPSLSASNQIFTVHGSSSANGQTLQIGASNAGPWAMWMQVSYDGNPGFSSHLGLQPLGGNTGIGTVNPLNQLSVIPPGGVTALGDATQFSIGENSNNSQYRLTLGYYAEGPYYKGVIQASHNGQANGRLLLQPSGGAVCVGQQTTPNVSVPLTVFGSSVGPSLTPGADNGIVKFQGAVGVDLDIGGYPSGAFSMWLQARHHTAASAYGIVLQPIGGAVGIGNPNPVYSLDVVGDVNITGVYRLNGTPISGGFTTQSIVTGSRAINTGTYQNTSGKLMFVVADVGSATALQVFGVSDASSNPGTFVDSDQIPSGSGGRVFMNFFVLPGHYYKVTTGGGGTLNQWIEYT